MRKGEIEVAKAKAFCYSTLNSELVNATQLFEFAARTGARESKKANRFSIATLLFTLDKEDSARKDRSASQRSLPAIKETKSYVKSNQRSKSCVIRE
ncbi:unnamed protein product (mitochondrion) [Arabidopsis thaliana]|uniref:(thale cress) hypothetical protein n=1 Tax=Arabidopsis thaliana TaxID=3702 RepID=A0A7G2FJT0_ARATH|nr:unnamed protein product [Arabidopsis thaliana]CAD5336217.1 unnamed protein product [Arabidopsis thaliana]